MPTTEQKRDSQQYHRDVDRLHKREERKKKVKKTKAQSNITSTRYAGLRTGNVFVPSTTPLTGFAPSTLRQTSGGPIEHPPVNEVEPHRTQNPVFRPITGKVADCRPRRNRGA